jgi:BolA protein
MSVKDIISARLVEGLRPDTLTVTDESHLHAGHAGSRPEGETHFRVQITAQTFAGKSRVERHRLINALVAEELRTRVHALAIEARAPDEPGR